MVDDVSMGLSPHHSNLYRHDEKTKTDLYVGIYQHLHVCR